MSDAHEERIVEEASDPWKKYPQAEAVNALARGIGAARSGDAAMARQQQTRLLALRDAATEAKLAYWVGQIARIGTNSRWGSAPSRRQAGQAR